MNKLIITIDGQTACGKNTVGTQLADKLSLAYFDSGLLMRLLAYNYDESKSIDNIVNWSSYRYVNENELYYMGKNIIYELKSEDVANVASRIGKIKEIGDYVTTILRKFRNSIELPYLGAVFTGRIGGSVIFPDAPFQFFLTASAEVRSRRRYLELLQKNPNIEYNQIYTQVIERDRKDQNSHYARLQPSLKASIIDTTLLTSDEVFYLIYSEVIGNQSWSTDHY